MIPIHLSDFHLMGIHWVDAALRFGLRSAQKLFSAVADALLWVMFVRGVSDGIHYLDDWWAIFSENWNGINASEVATHTFFSDASGSWGCGAAWHNQWLQLEWPQTWQSVKIAVKELVPAVLAMAMWGLVWSRKKVEVRCCSVCHQRRKS